MSEIVSGPITHIKDRFLIYLLNAASFYGSIVEHTLVQVIKDTNHVYRIYTIYEAHIVKLIHPIYVCMAAFKRLFNLVTIKTKCEYKSFWLKKKIQKEHENNSQ